jgi:hypothetical protein
MITENLSTLKIHKLTREQYERELAAGRIDEYALYLTPDEELDLSGYATKDEIDATVDTINAAIEDIKDGTTPVAEATKATQDGAGNVITTTYETKTAVDQKLAAAKAYTDEQIAAIPNPSWNDLTDKPFGEEGIAPITWDGDIAGRTKAVLAEGETYSQGWAKVSDRIFSADELLNATVSPNAMGDIVLDESQITDMGGAIKVGDGVIYSVYDTNFTLTGTNYSVQFPETGTYFMYLYPDGGSPMYVTSLVLSGDTVKTLDEKFIPDTIARVTDVTALGEEVAATKTELEGKITDAQNAAEATAAGALATARTEIAAEIDAAKTEAVNQDAVILAEAQTYANDKAAALKAELEGKIDAIDNHSHENKDVLDGVTADKVTAWDGKLDANGWVTTETSFGKTFGNDDGSSVKIDLNNKDGITIASQNEATGENNSVNLVASPSMGATMAIRRGNNLTLYGWSNVQCLDKTSMSVNSISFPAKSGTFALTSDIDTLAGNTYTKEQTYTKAEVEALLEAQNSWGEF